MPKQDFSSLSDQNLLDLWWAGDQKAGSFLFDKHQSFVFATAEYFLKNKNNAADISQDIWKSIFAKQQQKINTFRPWILRVTKNRCLDFLKRKEHQVTQAINDQEWTFWTDDDNPEKQLIAQDQTEHTHKIINHLSPMQAQCFRLIVLEGRSYKEVAQLLQVKVRAVEVVMRGARKRLRKFEHSGIFKTLRGDEK